MINIKTGEVLAAVSLPNYNPNNPKEALLPDRLNRITGATYELGSVIKAVTFAMAFETGVTDLNGKFDARQPLEIGRARIHDYHATHRILTVPEVFVHSSNIGTAQHGARCRHRGAPGVPEEAGPVRAAGDRTARGGVAAASQALGQA